MSLNPEIRSALEGVSTATLTTVLLKKGLRNVWMRGTTPLGKGHGRRVGEAFTLRFVPARERSGGDLEIGADVDERHAFAQRSRTTLALRCVALRLLLVLVCSVVVFVLALALA